MHRHLAKVSFVNGLHNTLQYSSSSALSETRLAYLLVTQSTFPNESQVLDQSGQRIRRVLQALCKALEQFHLTTSPTDVPTDNRYV